MWPVITLTKQQVMWLGHMNTKEQHLLEKLKNSLEVYENTLYVH